MSLGYTIDEVLQTTSCFVQNLDQTWGQLEERHETVQNLYFHQLNEIFKNQELENAAQTQIKNEHKKHDDIKLSLQKNEVHLQSLKDNVTREKELKLELENKLKKLERDVQEVKENIQSTLDDRDIISMQKDVILTYKLLTNTSFVYTTKTLTGIVTKDPPKSFSFNPEELSKEEITQNLWQLVLDYKN